MLIAGSVVTVVGSFEPIAIAKDIQKRGGKAIPELADNTNYVLVGNNLSSEDSAIVEEANKLGVPCITLDHYQDQMPDDLEAD